MNPKFRPLYLIFGAIGLVLLIVKVIIGLPNVDPAMVLYIAVPDFVFFYLAYKTYPEEAADTHYQHVNMSSGK